MGSRTILALVFSVLAVPAWAQGSVAEKVRRYAVYRSDTREFDMESPGKMIALTDTGVDGIARIPRLFEARAFPFA